MFSRIIEWLSFYAYDGETGSEMLSHIIEWLSRIRDNVQLMRVLRRIALVMDILSLAIPVVLYNHGIIGSAPAGVLTMVSILNVSLALLNWANRMHDRRTGGQGQINDIDFFNLYSDEPDDMSAKPKPPRRLKAKDRKPPWEL